MQFAPEKVAVPSAGTILQINEHSLNSLDLLVILGQQHLIPSVVQSVLLDEAIASFQPNLEEQTIAYQQLRKKYNLQTESGYFEWLTYQGLTPQQFYQLAIRNWQIEKFQKQEWGSQLPLYFLERKSQLDRVVYSLLRTRNRELGLELYFRIREEENTFAEMAVQYSEGDEVYTKGLIGPVEMGQVHPIIAQQLKTSQPGQVWAPTLVDEWTIIVRLEQFIPAHLDETMECRLLNELYERSMVERIKQTNLSFPEMGTI